MKNLFTAVITLLFVVPLCAQTTAPSSGGREKKATAIPPATTNSTLSTSQSEILEAIENRMIRVEGGEFTMGCPAETDSTCYYWEKPAHKVKLSTFYMAKYAVTQKEWQAIVGDKPWFSKDCAECPVENVSWYDAQIFISKLNQLTGKFYRLPTEAEWEYAARGGNKSKNYKFAGGNNLNLVGWYEGNSNKVSHPVGAKLPNELGLYDMSGNVWQWCSDWFDDKYYSTSPAENPQGPGRDSYRACRGGSWWSEEKDCRLSNRDRYPPDARDDDVGFRIAKD
ncbi:MAG TPA: formylglycine-generating enzyme family protein [Chitinophagales bacterium]|nr:formylglycine-generating enzyme family protein [Chitinophagales bacterium]